MGIPPNSTITLRFVKSQAVHYDGDGDGIGVLNIPKNLSFKPDTYRAIYPNHVESMLPKFPVKIMPAVQHIFCIKYGNHMFQKIYKQNDGRLLGNFSEFWFGMSCVTGAVLDIHGNIITRINPELEGDAT